MAEVMTPEMIAFEEQLKAAAKAAGKKYRPPKSQSLDLEKTPEMPEGDPNVKYNATEKADEAEIEIDVPVPNEEEVLAQNFSAWEEFQITAAEKLQWAERTKYEKNKAYLSKYTSLAATPESGTGQIYDMFAGLDPEERAAEIKKARELNGVILNHLKEQNPGVEFYQNDNGVLYMISESSGLPQLLQYNLLDQIRDNKFQIGGGVFGSYTGFQKGLKKPPNPKGKFRATLKGIAGWAVPGSRESKILRGGAWLINNVTKPVAYSIAMGGAGTGAGQFADDVYNSLYIGKELIAADLVMRSAQAAKASVADDVALGGIAVPGKALFNKFIGRHIFSLVSGASIPLHGAAGAGLLIEAIPGPTKLFDDPKMILAFKELGLDVNDPNVRQGIIDEVVKFRKNAKDMTPDELLQLYGMKTGVDANALSQSENLTRAVRAKPGAIGVAEQKKVFDAEYGRTKQGLANAQARLNEIRELYPKGTDMPPSIANEAVILRSGLAASPLMNSVSRGLTDPGFWDGTANVGDFMDSPFLQKMSEAAEGFQIGKWKFFGPKTAVEDTKAVPPGIATGVRGTVAGKASPGLESVATGANKTQKHRDNALTWIEGRDKQLGAALESPDAMVFDPVAFKSLENMVEVNYDAVLTGAKSLGSDKTYNIVGKDGVDLSLLKRAEAEAENVGGPSATFIRELNERIDPAKVYTTEELLDLVAWMRAQARTKGFNKTLLPNGQRFFDSVMITADKRIAADLAKTPQGRRALRILKSLRGRKNKLAEVRSNRVYQRLETYTNKNTVGGKLTPENIIAMRKIIAEEGLKEGDRSMALLLNKMPKNQSRSLANTLFDEARNKYTTVVEGKEIVDTEAMLHALAPLREVKLPWVQAKMRAIQNYHDVMGGAKRIVQTEAGQGRVNALYRALTGTGSGIGTDVKERGVVFAVGVMFKMMKETALEKLGQTPAKFGQLHDAAAKFFANPLKAEASIAFSRQLAELRKQSTKVGDAEFAADILEVEKVVNRLKSDAATAAGIGTPFK